MPPLAALEELAELAASYSAAHERSRASRPSSAAAREADAALILSAIDLASVAIDAVAELAAVAQHPQLSAALSKAAIVSVAVLSERELASAQSGAPVDASGALSGGQVPWSSSGRRPTSGRAC